LAEAADSKAVQSLSQQQTAWLKRLPKTPQALWQWCLSAPTDTLLSLLAFCSALSVNAVQRKNDTDAERIHHADALATALHIDMRNWFTPTAANFFSKVSKTRIFDAMSEAGKTDAAHSAANLKKGPLAEFAETTLAASGWLPEPIRIAPGQPEDTTFADEEEEVNHPDE
jgi:ParB family chromosome partitioning protein